MGVDHRQDRHLEAHADGVLPAASAAESARCCVLAMESSSLGRSSGARSRGATALAPVGSLVVAPGRDRTATPTAG